MQETDSQPLTTGIGPFDEHLGGLDRGGSFLVVGMPGPAKMVAAMQFVYEGLRAGERCAFLTGAEEEENFFAVARAWGFDFEPFWRDGTLQLVGFREDFELRAIRSVDPDDVIEELGTLLGEEPTRIAVDPGSLFLVGGVRSRLGSAYLKWARRHAATVWTTFPVDDDASTLPSSVDWMIQMTTGRVMIEPESDDLYEMSIVKSIPDSDARVELVTVELRPGKGLVAPDGRSGRRARQGIDRDRLLLISLASDAGDDVRTWATNSFDADIVSEPFEAVARVQDHSDFGGILIHGPRTRIREAVTACRALRPLSRAAIVFASDDAIRSRDRVNLLEAGADDCLSGGIDFRELDVRMRQAVDAGARPPSSPDRDGTGADEQPGGSISPGEFTAEFERRAEHPILSFFCVVEAIADEMEASDLTELLSTQIRDEDGDLLTCDGKRCLVLLQGAREGQLSNYLGRLRARIGERTGLPPDSAVRLDVFSHPSQSGRIRTILEL
ncbi:MAG TPA: ATPase domain-containing protein [Longimicrobiales bacterium]|nr:ATPase domain-containing protein [Longimicrobiales bacterium]